MSTIEARRAASRKYYLRHKEAEKARSKEWCRANPEKRKAWAEKNKERRRANSRKSDHNLLPEEFDSKFKAQGGKCAICSKINVRLDVDHDHSCCPGRKNCGKCNRGLLCRSCNTFIGLAKDSVELLESAIQYLRSHQ